MDLVHGWRLAVADQQCYCSGQRLCRYAEIVGRERVIAGVDCGFGTFAGGGYVFESIIWAKLAALTEGARLASEELWS